MVLCSSTSFFTVCEIWIGLFLLMLMMYDEMTWLILAQTKSRLFKKPSSYLLAINSITNQQGYLPKVITRKRYIWWHIIHLIKSKKNITSKEEEICYTLIKTLLGKLSCLFCLIRNFIYADNKRQKRIIKWHPYTQQMQKNSIKIDHIENCLSLKTVLTYYLLNGNYLRYFCNKCFFDLNSSFKYFENGFEIKKQLKIGLSRD